MEVVLQMSALQGNAWILLVIAGFLLCVALILIVTYPQDQGKSSADKSRGLMRARGRPAVPAAISRRSERDRQRLAGMPREMDDAFRDAKTAMAQCLAVCGAAAYVRSLRSGSGAEELRSRRGGPTEDEVFAARQAICIKALTRCHWLSVEALKLTYQANYLALRGVFEAALAACDNCRPEAGKDNCPALVFMEKVTLS